MDDRVFMVKTLGEALSSIEMIPPNPDNGFYALYMAEDATQLMGNATCAVIFLKVTMTGQLGFLNSQKRIT
jgi:hypothetical protein